MKKSLTFLLAFLMLGAIAFSQKIIKTYHYPYTQKKIKEVYTVNASGAMNGLYQLFESNGAKLIVANYKNGDYHGNLKEYLIMCDPGKEKLKLDENYVNGQKHGICKRWGAEEHYVAKFDNGKLIEETEYYSTGKKKSFATLVGICSEWYPNGKKKEEFSVDTYNKHGKYTSWYENDQIKEDGNYEMGEKNSNWTSFYESGQKLSEYDYAQKTFKRFSLNGQLIFDGNFDNFIHAQYYDYSGRLTEYYANGNKLLDCNIKNMRENCIAEGLNKEKLESIERLFINPKSSSIDGKLQMWYENSQLYIECSFKNNMLDGEYKKYYTDGKIKIKGTYQNGKAVLMQYNENGNLTSINDETPYSYYSKYCEQQKKYVDSKYYSGDVMNKKVLYKKFLKVEENYNAKILSETVLNKTIPIYDELIKLYTKMFELRDTETTEIETNLKKAKTPEEIKAILGL